MKITFLLLAHQYPTIVKRLIEALIGAGHSVVIHYDEKAPAADYELLTLAFSEHSRVRFARRVTVGWGEWSIVKATLNCIEEIEAANWNPDYVYYASGADYPIRGAAELEAFLTRNYGKEFIEGVPANTVRWVKGGPQQERYQYRFYFNWRTHHKVGKFLLNIQKKLRLKRKFVFGLEPYIGSQWWVLTWDTLMKVMETARRSESIKFFQTTLIPDELFFQTFVYNLVPKSRIVGRPLTLYQFTDYMIPVVFCYDRVEYLLRQPFFMARKLSTHRTEFFDELDACWRGERTAAPFIDEQVGTVSPEYETTRLAQRDGLPGLPIAGKAADPWSGGLAWLEKPYFAVLGTTAAELRFAHALLSGHKELLCHGQLFHPNSIEFAHGMTSFAGYGTRDVVLRNLSAPNFLADIMRAERYQQKRYLQTGFLLRFGHGWHIPEVLFDRPNAKVLVVYGDPLIGFIESLAGVEPLIESSLKSTALRSMPPTILVKKFEEYEKHFNWIRWRLGTMIEGSKAKGTPPSWSWLTELDLNTAKSPRVGHRGARLAEPSPLDWAATTLARWRDWLTQAEICLGVRLTQHVDDRIWSRFATELAIRQDTRQVLVDLLIAGGREAPIPAIPVADGPAQQVLDPAQSVASALADIMAGGFSTKVLARAALSDDGDVTKLPPASGLEQTAPGDHAPKRSPELGL